MNKSQVWTGTLALILLATLAAWSVLLAAIIKQGVAQEDVWQRARRGEKIEEECGSAKLESDTQRYTTFVAASDGLRRLGESYDLYQAVFALMWGAILLWVLVGPWTMGSTDTPAWPLGVSIVGTVLLFIFFGVWRGLAGDTLRNKVERLGDAAEIQNVEALKKADGTLEKWISRTESELDKTRAVLNAVIVLISLLVGCMAALLWLGSKLEPPVGKGYLVLVGAMLGALIGGGAGMVSTLNMAKRWFKDIWAPYAHHRLRLTRVVHTSLGTAGTGATGNSGQCVPPSALARDWVARMQSAGSALKVGNAPDAALAEQVKNEQTNGKLELFKYVEWNTTARPDACAVTVPALEQAENIIAAEEPTMLSAASDGALGYEVLWSVAATLAIYVCLRTLYEKQQPNVATMAAGSMIAVVVLAVMVAWFMRDQIL